MGDICRSQHGTDPCCFPHLFPLSGLIPGIDQGLIRHTWGGSWEDGRGLLGVDWNVRAGWTIGGLNVQDGLVISRGPFLQNGLC